MYHDPMSSGVGSVAKTIIDYRLRALTPIHKMSRSELPFDVYIMVPSNTLQTNRVEWQNMGGMRVRTPILTRTIYMQSMPRYPKLHRILRTHVEDISQNDLETFII
ncbi:hypothetical protein HW555_002260 [Spodoptera exigua]|uniref:Uncharacterized protein n=1 Tax=Spodoptera exigua TaxID=7107 RepID=A0A835LAB0_SPOEX|nr:hypothetical protein HW555_002260 [Spodoptera exigua]